MTDHHASLDAALEATRPTAEDVEALRVLLHSLVCPSDPDVCCWGEDSPGDCSEPTGLEEGILASDWLAAHTAAAKREGVRAVVEAVEATWSAIPNPQHPGTGAALRKAAHDAACVCAPCLGRGNDGHGLSHCAECCYGTGVEVDLACLVHGPYAAAREAAARIQGGA